MHPNDKTDLCAQVATVDFTFLLECAASASFMARVDVERRLNEVQNNYGKPVTKLQGQWLAEAAERFRKANELYYVLTEAKRRETLNIVNKPYLPD